MAFDAAGGLTMAAFLSRPLPEAAALDPLLQLVVREQRWDLAGRLGPDDAGRNRQG